MEGLSDGCRGVLQDRLIGFATDAKIPIRDLQGFCKQAFAAKLIPIPAAAAPVMDYTILDEVSRKTKDKVVMLAGHLAESHDSGSNALYAIIQSARRMN